MHDSPTDAALDHLHTLAWHFASHQTLVVAARLGMLRALALRALDGEELAQALNLDPLATGKLLRALCAMGVLEADAGRYAVPAALRGAFLGGDGDQTPYLLHSWETSQSWALTLEQWARTGTQAPRQRDPEQLRCFAEAMWAVSMQLAPRVLERLPLSGVRRVMDLGGGLGAWAVSVCRRVPEAEGLVLDRGPVLALGAQRLEGGPLAGRVRFEEGDYHHHPLGEAWDLIVLSSVLHLERAAGARALLRRCADALSPGGRLLLVDFRIDEAQQQELHGALFALNMRSFGDTWPEGQIRAWLRELGLSEGPRLDLPGGRWAIVAEAPSPRLSPRGGSA